MRKKQIALLTVGILALMTLTAGASVYLAKQTMNDDKPKAVATTKTSTKRQSARNDITWDNPNQVRQTTQTTRVQTAAACDDGNIAGKAVGGVGGGVLGSMLGKGKGKTATTIGGTLAGAYAGGEVIPLRNATCSR